MSPWRYKTLGIRLPLAFFGHFLLLPKKWMLASVKLISQSAHPHILRGPSSFLAKNKSFRRGWAVKFLKTTNAHPDTCLKRLSTGGCVAVLTSCLCYFIPVSVIGSTAGKAEIRFRWDHSCHGFKNWTTSVLLLLRSGRQEGRKGGGGEPTKASHMPGIPL